MNILIFNNYYWARYKNNQKIVVVFYYNDGYEGSFETCGSEEIFGVDEFHVLKRIEPYEG